MEVREKTTVAIVMNKKNKPRKKGRDREKQVRSKD